jgi:hypothetical protein
MQSPRLFDVELDVAILPILQHCTNSAFEKKMHPEYSAGIETSASMD